MNDLNKEAFQEEARELLAELEDALMELEDDPRDTDCINRVFRSMHTIKGSGAMFGFEAIAAFTHEVETVFDQVRSGAVEVDKGLCDLTLEARDHIKLLLEGGETGAKGEEIIRGLRACLPEGFATAGQDETAAAAEQPEREAGKEVTYRVVFRPARDIFLTGTNPLHLLEELSELGRSRVLMRTDCLPPLPDLDPEQCMVWWEVILTTDQGEDAVRDVFIFVDDQSEVLVEAIDLEDPFEQENSMRLGEILRKRGELTREQLEEVIASKKKIGELLVAEGLVSEGAVLSALAEQEEIRRVKARKQRGETLSSIRVQADKLDQLVDLVGELVIVQAKLKQYESERQDPRLSAISEELEHLSNDLRDNTLNIRMVPFGTSFSRFKRLVRDLTAEMGKEIRLLTVGAETELDKTVIEKLGDPLVHLLRNSIDHGIETPQERVSAGKEPVGTIRLEALHCGGEVHVKIVDDGKGIDTEKLRSKAVEKGLLAAEAELSEKELLQLIFAPGMSTADAVTSVSGRGVGMDVVRRSIESLRGKIELDSTRGTGTTITIKLPLTLAIIEGLQVRVGESFFIIPLSLVEECTEITRSGKDSEEGRQLISIRGELVPFVSLRTVFGINGHRPKIEQIVVTEVEGSRIGLKVDDVIGEHQTVIKSLGSVYKHVREISGATIKGDGSVALIVDVRELIRSAVA